LKINQVEQLVGVTKKNIRFYESEGLLSPQRNAGNGYREYSEEDIEQLKKIKLLRKLSLPIEEIRKIFSGECSLWETLSLHQNELRRQMEGLKKTAALCEEMVETRVDLAAVSADDYLNQMERLEREGIKFANLQNNDLKKLKGSVSALVIDLAMVVIMLLIIWSHVNDPLPTVVFVLLLLFPVIIIIGVQYALRQRFLEIEGGEEDAASKY